MEKNIWYLNIKGYLSNIFKYYDKARVIGNGLIKLINTWDKLNYENCLEGIIQDSRLDDLYIDMLFKYGLNDIKTARNVNKAYYSRVQRLRDRITKYIETGRCIFATLTFTDKVLKETNRETRRKYVTRYLKSISNFYVANIDFGVDDLYTHREHYHALILIPFIDEKWDYGYTWFEKVNLDNQDSNKLISKYISKLTNHAIKDSVKRNYIIYSREKEIIYYNKFYYKIDRFLPKIF